MVVPGVGRCLRQDPQPSRHSEVNNDPALAAAVNQQVFCAALDRADRYSACLLIKPPGYWPTQARIAYFNAVNPLSDKMWLQPAARRFDFR